MTVLNCAQRCEAHSQHLLPVCQLQHDLLSVPQSFQHTLNHKPLQVRGLASGAAATANWLANAVVSQTFLVLTQHLGGSGTFWIYTAVSLGGLLWMFHALPETNGGPSMLDEGVRLTLLAHQTAVGQYRTDLSWAMSEGYAAMTASLRHQA